MMQTIRAWEAEDATFIVLGTHDAYQAVPAVLAYCAYNGFTPGTDEYQSTLERVRYDAHAKRWVPKDIVDNESWAGSKSAYVGQDFTMFGYLPYLIWY